MTIRRLDVIFFTTHLTIDEPDNFNTATNFLFTPLQRVFGKNQFESLSGRVNLVHEPLDFSSSFCKTLGKVVVVVCAFFIAIVLTPIGIVTRYMSFRSPQIERAYSHARLLQMDPFNRPSEEFAFIQKMHDAERLAFLGDLSDDLVLAFLSFPAHQDSTNAFLFQRPVPERNEIFKQLPPSVQGPFLSLDTNTEFAKGHLQETTESEYLQLMPHLSTQLIENYPALMVEKEKKQSLDKCLTTAIQSLENLEAGLNSKGAQDPWVTQFRSDPLYPFPFLLAQQLEAHPKIAARADKDLWKRFMALRQSCQAFLTPDCDNALLQTTRVQANATIRAIFLPNVRFFNELKKFESKKEKAKIQEWIEEQRSVNNFYPFYSMPRILKLMGQTINAEKLLAFSETVSSCLSLLNETGLGEYISEKPDPQNVNVRELMQALDRLENIGSLQDLIKNQTA